jgi:hypothetical protein
MKNSLILFTFNVKQIKVARVEWKCFEREKIFMIMKRLFDIHIIIFLILTLLILFSYFYSHLISYQTLRNTQLHWLKTESLIHQKFALHVSISLTFNSNFSYEVASRSLDFGFVIFWAQKYRQKARVKCWWNWYHFSDINCTYFAFLSSLSI